jgi:outer membrane biosynthesis protein TonB
MFLGPHQVWLALAALAVSAVVGCGSAVRKPVVLGRSTVLQLDHELTLARSAMAAHSRGRAVAAVDAFARLVESHAGDISSADLRDLRIAIAQARARIPVDIVPVAVSSPASTTSVQAQPAPQPVSPKPAKPPAAPKPKPTPPTPPKPKPTAPKAPTPPTPPAPAPAKPK